MRVILFIVAVACAGLPAQAAETFRNATSGGPLDLSQRPACVMGDISNPAAACKLAEPDAESAADGRARYLASKAVLWAYVQRWDNAYADIADAVALRPDDAELAHQAARTALTAYTGLFDRKWIERGTAHIEAALRQRPRDPDALVTRAYLERYQGRVGDAMKSFDQALALAPQSSVARSGRGEMYLGMNEPESAVFDFDIALKSSPGDERIRAQRVSALIRLSRDTDALADLNILLAGSPNDFQLLNLRVRINTGMGRVTDALRDLDYLLGMEGNMRRFALGGQIVTSLLMQRAMLRFAIGREAEATQDYLLAMETATKPDILRLQVYLRRNGFPAVALDGQVSDGFKAAIKACFGERKCRAGITARDA